jgi:hypothetical protein
LGDGGGLAVGVAERADVPAQLVHDLGERGV